MINLCVFVSLKGIIIYKVNDGDFLAMDGADVCDNKQADICHYIVNNYNIDKLSDDEFNILVIDFDGVAYRLFDNLKEAACLNIVSAKMLFAILLRGKIKQKAEDCNLVLRDKYFNVKISDSRIVGCDYCIKNDKNAVVLTNKDFEKLFDCFVDFSSVEQERQRYLDLENKYKKLQHDCDELRNELDNIEYVEVEDDIEKTDYRQYAWAQDYLIWSEKDSKNYYVSITNDFKTGSTVKKGDIIVKLVHINTKKGTKCVKAQRDGKLLLYVKEKDKFEKPIKKDSLLFIVGNDDDSKKEMKNDVEKLLRLRNSTD